MPMQPRASPCGPLCPHATASACYPGAASFCRGGMPAPGLRFSPLDLHCHCHRRCMAPSTFRYKENKTIFTADYWKVGWFADVTRYAEALAPVLQAHFGTTKLLAGECHSSGQAPLEAAVEGEQVVPLPGCMSAHHTTSAVQECTKATRPMIL